MSDAQQTNIAIVTGSSAGLGHAVARLLLERGWSVVGIARRPSPFTSPRYRHICFDLARVVDDSSSLARELERHVGSAERARVGLVNNAAAPEGLMPLERLDPHLLARVFAVNTIAAMWLMGHVVRVTSPNATLRIVNVSSGAGTTGFPGLAAYGASKAALRLAGMSLAREWDGAVGPPGAALEMRRPDAAILSYEPGVVDTDMQTYARSRPPDEFPWVGIFEDFLARGLAVSPMRPALEIVDFLASTAAPPFTEQRFRS
jgi:benzil reductase ((S)-benzoin forming)